MTARTKAIQSLILNKDGQRALAQKSAAIWTFWSLEQARTSKGRLRYHMGQVAMIRFINALLADGHEVCTALCDADHLTMKADARELWRENIHASERFIDLNTDAAVKKRRMSDVLQSHIEKGSTKFFTIREVVMDVLLRFRDAMLFHRLSEPALRDLVKYRYYPPPKPPASLAGCSAKLQKLFGVPEDLLLTLVYLFFSRPSWFSAFWQADFTACLALEGTNGGILLEAHRNAYAWQSMECIFRIAQTYPVIAKMKLNWPRMAFFRSLPAVDGEGFMKLDIPTGCIFLDATEIELEKQLAKFTEATRKEFCKVLNLGQPLSATANKSNQYIRRVWLEHRDRSKELLASLADKAPSASSKIRQSKSVSKTKAALLDNLDDSFDVFLCHNSKDKPTVEKIGLQLCEAGIKPWLDKWQIRPGLRWQQVLEDQIDSVRGVAVFIGPNDIGPWQQEEIYSFLSQFINNKCPVIPVYLKGSPKQIRLPVFLRNRHFVDFRKSDPDPFEQLLWGITANKKTKYKTNR